MKTSSRASFAASVKQRQSILQRFGDDIRWWKMLRFECVMICGGNNDAQTSTKIKRSCGSPITHGGPPRKKLVKSWRVMRQACIKWIHEAERERNDGESGFAYHDLENVYSNLPPNVFGNKFQSHVSKATAV